MLCYFKSPRAQGTISEPMRWQERGDAGGNICTGGRSSYGRQQQRTHVAAREDLRVMTQGVLQKVAAAVVVSTHI